MAIRRFSKSLAVFAILVIANLLIVRVFMHKQARAQEINGILSEIESMKAIEQGAGAVAGAVGDVRIANLKNFFRKYNSPLFDHAEFIVETSDKYKFDYRLLPAIAMQESGLCRVIPNNSHNCWGWGIYGNTVTRFDSYEDAIDTVARGLRKNYLDKGLVTASQIMSKYTPSSNGSWARGVNTFLKVLE